MNLSIAIPDSALSDEKTLENKTRKISSIARSCGIFRVNEIIIYRDGKKNESDSKLFITILKYLETPQYFRKTVFGLPTVALPVKDKIWIGSFRSDRIAYLNLDQN